jgi:hypothetical protein
MFAERASRHESTWRSLICTRATVAPYDANSAKKKLQPTYRDPFVISGFGGDYGKTYTIRQVNDIAIPRTFYGDDLKAYRLREGYLITGTEQSLLVYQNLRPGNATHKLPKNAWVISGTWKLVSLS